jgi:hypothetical protein
MNDPKGEKQPDSAPPASTPLDQGKVFLAVELVIIILFAFLTEYSDDLTVTSVEIVGESSQAFA